MACFPQKLNTPAMLRALADVAEHYPHLNADFSTYDYWDLLEWVDGRKNSTIAVSLSFDILAKEPGFRIAMGKAYRKHGGDPSTFLSGPELTNAMAY